MTRTYPEAVAGPYDAPPDAFTDRAGRRVEIRAYGTGSSDDSAAGRPDESSARESGGPTGREAEYEALVETYLAFDPEDRAQGIPPVGEERIRDWLDVILAPACHNVVAWHGDDAVGHATLVPEADRGETGEEPPYELAIFVLRDYQEAGIGTRLMESLLGLGRERGVDRVWLTVERWNHAAVALYEKVGFEPIDTGGFELEMTASLR